MVTIAIYGAGGFGRETKLLIEAINRDKPRFNFQGFLDDQPKPTTQLAKTGSFQSMAIAIALPATREKIFMRCGNEFEYPSLIHPDVFVDSTVQAGKGMIICSGVKITSDVRLGDFVIINLNATIGHDVSMGLFSSIMPGANISGNVKLGDRVFVGSGANILQGLSIGDGAIIGAGAVVTKNVPAGAVVKGVPGRWC